jgi:hypothetical protein
MVSFKLGDLNKAIEMLLSQNLVAGEDIDKAVYSVARKMENHIVNQIDAMGLVDSGSLKNSIDSFQRTRRGQRDPYWTYYVGPRYARRYSLYYGGNHAHFLEYGVLYSSYPIKGKGWTSKKGVKYGEFSSKQGYRIKPYGFMKKARELHGEALEKDLKVRLMQVFLNHAKERGFEIKKGGL